MSMVWNSGLPKNQKMCLLAYADHANDDGTSVYPGEAKMKDKTSDSAGNVRRVTKLLIEDGLLIQTKRGHRGQRAEYRINIETLAAHLARHSEELKGAQEEKERRAESADRRALRSRKARAAATPNHQDPSQPSGNHQIALIDLPHGYLTTGKYRTAMKDALVEAMEWEPKEVTKRQWDKVEVAAKELCDIEADPSDVWFRTQVYRVNFAGATMTPLAIATNWADLKTPREPIPARQVRRAATRANTRAAMAALDVE